MNNQNMNRYIEVTRRLTTATDDMTLLISKLARSPANYWLVSQAANRIATDAGDVEQHYKEIKEMSQHG